MSNGEALSDIHFDEATEIRAKYIVSHLLLDDGAHVVDVGCGDGELIAAIASHNPRLQITAVDRNQAMLDRASKKYRLPNLSYVHADVFNLPFEEGSVDAVINCRFFGHLYSRNGYSLKALDDALKEEHRVLKDGGTMLTFDFMCMPEDKYVLIEFPIARKNKGLRKKEDRVTEGDRHISNLIWFHENARPKQANGCQGFFLEEVPQRLPFTRLFRLPYKWAYEFIIRMDSFGETIDREIATEMTIVDRETCMRAFEGLNYRVDYDAQWTNSYTVKSRFHNVFKLYDDDYKSLAYPPSGHVFVSKKLGSKQPLTIQERRQSKNMPSVMQIHSLRDDQTGGVLDLVTPEDDLSTLIPYRIDQEGRLKVVLRQDKACPVMNSVERNGHNLDGRRWSGFLIAPIQVAASDVRDLEDKGSRSVLRYMLDNFRLKTDGVEMFVKGPQGYPAPDFVETCLETQYLAITNSPEMVNRGLCEYDCKDVLRAIRVGFIPDAWLEVQLLHLMNMLGFQCEDWMGQELPMGQEPPPADRIMRVEDIMSQIYEDPENKTTPKQDTRYRDVKGHGGQLRVLRSVFVEDVMNKGYKAGHGAQEHEFAVHVNETVNRAAILSLTRDLDGNALGGFELTSLPVPYRFGQKEKMLNLPTVSLPRDIKNMDEARQFVADSFETELEKVVAMGPSFFSYIDATPQRIFPLAVAREGGWGGDRNVIYAPLGKLWMLDETDYKWSMLFSYGFSMISMRHQQVSKDAGYSTRIEENKARFTMRAPQRSVSSSGGGKASSSWNNSSSTNDNAGAKNSAPYKDSVKKTYHGMKRALDK